MLNRKHFAFVWSCSAKEAKQSVSFEVSQGRKRIRSSHEDFVFAETSHHIQ